jgi:hypothetical protein
VVSTGCVVVVGELPGSLGARWPLWSASAERRAAAEHKLLIYNEDHLALIHREISTLLGGGLSAAYVKLFAKRMPNALMAVANTIAVGYRSGVRRELRDASPEVSRAFADLVTECGINRKAPGLNARSWAAGPHIIAPHFTRRGKLALDIIEPSRCDVVRDGDDIDEAIWHQGKTWVLLDGEAWRYFDADGHEIDGAVYHAVGVCPAVPFVSFDGGADFWAATAHNGLVDATLTIAYKVALGLFARQVSGIPLTVIFSRLEKMAPGQTLGHPILPLLLDPAEDKVQVFDERVVGTEYLQEISALLTMAVSAEGLPPGSITMQANQMDSGGLAINAEGPRLAALRDKQVPELKASELALWPLVADLVRGSVHRHARLMPPGDELRDMLRVSFPDLSPPEEQLKRIEVMKAKLPFGLSSPSDVELAARPEVTREEVDEVRKDNLADYIATIEPLTERNVPAEAPEARGYQTLPQQQGRAGGQASGQTRAAQAQETTP